MRTLVALALIGTLASPVAAQQQDYFSAEPQQQLTYRVEGERTRGELILLASLTGGALAFAGIGLYFQLDYSDGRDDIEAFAGEHTNRIYTPELDDRRHSAERSGTIAGVAYGTAGALVAATIVTYIITHPADELREYRSGDDSRAGRTYIAPTDGGAMVGASWGF